ncbi:CD209 antigen-like protein E [Cheilinus undulatus]|uniref:CD209 antigen-like protein E n=1 Tax=Cheilinus undulatus TaxID=241271 RepID=UPI001BD5A70F|nr:CD209 antigen-like protein E [Cheilinus undulatus]
MVTEVKMPDADVLYSDVKFTKTKDKVNGTASPSEDTTYSEVRITKAPQPSAELSGPTPDAVSNGRSGLPLERISLLVFIVLFVLAAGALGYTTYKHTQTTEALQRLKVDYEHVKKNLTEKKCEVNSCIKEPPCPADGTCLKCEQGWERYGGSCYYFSKDRSSWDHSRDKCKQQGGELVKIESREEQVFLDVRLRDKMVEAEDKFWIGLTDVQREGTWMWADGSPLDKNLTFWSKGEPDNWTRSDGEDCTRMGEKGGAEENKSWFDKSCRFSHKYICEKPAENGKLECL